MLAAPLRVTVAAMVATQVHRPLWLAQALAAIQEKAVMVLAGKTRTAAVGLAAAAAAAEPQQKHQAAWVAVAVA